MDKEAPAAPMSSPVWKMPGTLIWGTIIAVIFIVTQISAMVVYIKIHFGDVAPPEFERLVMELQYDGTVISICTFAAFLICGPAIVCVVKFKKGSNLGHYLALKTVDSATSKYWALVMICLIVVSDVLTLLLGKPLVPEFSATVYKSTESHWMLLLAIIVAAPILEELFFRGFLFAGLSQSIVGPAGAVFISAFGWAAIHSQYDFFTIVSIFFMGLVLGAARAKSGSVLLAIGLHSLANLLASVETAFFTP